MPCLLPGVICLLFHTAANNYKISSACITQARKSILKTPSALEKNTQYRCLFLRAINKVLTHIIMRAELRRGYSDYLRAGRSGDRNPVEARFSAPVQTGPGAHPDSCTMGTGSFLGKERPGRDAEPSPPSSAVGHERVEL
jgi:hypothetical protein